ncbi:MAG: ROK family protein [Elusimicrobia bacterium]|nr:ROK family protein [Elusimicrobiota bacterium]
MLGIGIDIGGTNTKLTVLDRTGRFFREERFHTDPGAGPSSFMNRLCGVLKAFKNSYGKKLVSAGVGIAGDVDPEKGLLRFSPNLGWSRMEVAAPIKKMTGLCCFVENDANMAAWGAYVLELGRGPGNVLAITLGTGIGAGLIVNGGLYHGATGSAGEAGHVKIVPGGRQCHCGGRGCLEAYCGSYALLREARARIPDAEAFVKKYSAPGREKLNTICLTKAADAGHKTAVDIWAEMGGSLGRGLAGMLLLLNPDCVVLTGGVSRAARHFMPALKEVFRAQQIKTPFKTVKVKIAKNADLGAYGAALFGLEKAENGRA